MLITRILTAAVLAGAFIPALFLLPTGAWSALSLLVIAACAVEWAGLSGVHGRLWQAGYGACIAGCALAVMLSFLSTTSWYVAASLFWLLTVPWLLFKGRLPKSLVFKLAAGVLALVPAGLAMMEIRNLSPGLLLSLMAIVWISDSAAYFSGRAWGRRKLASAISPGKTWEGVYGALVCVLVYAIICTMTLEHIVIPRWLSEGDAMLLISIFWLALAVLGILGDLLESLFKRTAGVKDSGSLLPGHGGILDRVDALLPILPVSAIFYLR